MFRKLVALLPIAACLVAAADARAIPLDPYGTGQSTTDWNAPKVAPSTHCTSLMLYLADTPASPSGMRKYRFTGNCTFNTAPEGRVAKMKTVDVLVDAEYFPAMKRASERVVVQDPDFGTNLSTWATCPADPFLDANVTCTDKGMAANKWDKFINKDDAPFARRRATPSQVNTADKKWDLAKQRDQSASFYGTSKLASVSPVGPVALGAKSQVILNITGGSGYCPAELDFGDGKKEHVILWSPNIGPYQHIVEHQYAKKGTFKVSVRSLPGCSGQGSSNALVN